MAEKKTDKPEEEATPIVPTSTETPVELLSRAAERLEARRGHRNKTWDLMAAEIRGLIERIEFWEK